MRFFIALSFDFQGYDLKISNINRDAIVFAINAESGETPEYSLTDFGPKTKKLTELYTYTPLVSEREAVECEE